MNTARMRRLNKNGSEGPGPVLYWMSRDQRARDNWALIYAQKVALQKKIPLLVVFCLVPAFLGAAMRQYGFMLKGLQELEKSLLQKNIAFKLLWGSPQKELVRIVKKYKIGMVVTDFDPLRIKRQWKADVGKSVAVPLYEVDAHNIVPCWVASPKQEYGAYTIRPKIQHLLPVFLEEFPRMKRHPHVLSDGPGLNQWEKAIKTLKANTKIPEVDWIVPGERAARRALKLFVGKNLGTYDTTRNDPTVNGQSQLSPYLHFGHLSAQKVALAVQASSLPQRVKESFLEELIIRRELSDNFCLYTTRYDSFDSFPQWAQKTLNEHRKDKRPYIYTLHAFEGADTHDPLWNAAQMEVATKGKMHGYMRMYWAKKILEWTRSPEEALEYAIYLNDKYELDGRDPNGYAGIVWSIGGVHDRAWGARPIFGKVRYMSYNGCKSKFKVAAYIAKNTS
jgi:deoxyribodipyrimidine photo-lyase